jgi:hemin uptake protein HemP
MRARVSLLLLAGTVVLASCDQNKSADVVIKDKDGSVSISANGQHFTMRGGDGKQGNVTISGNGEHFTMHATDGGKAVVDIDANGVNVGGKLPAFVTVFPGARVTSSVSGGDANGGGGTVVMETKSSPADVIGFYKQKTGAAGFRQTLDANDSGTLLYSASAGTRAVQVLASKDSEGTHAQVTWSGK